MREIMPYIWLGIIIFALIAGVNTRSRTPLWLIPPGLTAFILSVSGAAVWRQACIFFILAAILLILSRTFFKKIIKLKNPLDGKAAIVTEEINNQKNTGEIRINGIAHTAKAEEDDIIYEAGIVVTVIGLDGIKAVCTR